jgi:hypothetical protein
MTSWVLSRAREQADEPAGHYSGPHMRTRVLPAFVQSYEK